MAGAAPARGALRPPTPLLLLLLLLPGSLCQTSSASTLPPSPPPSRLPLNAVTVGTNGSGAGARGGPACAGTGTLWVSPGPTSRTGTVGEHLSLECRYRAAAAAKVTWYRACPQRVGGGGDGGSCGPGEAVAEARQAGRRERQDEGLATLIFRHLSHNDSGLYFCRVQAAGGDAGRSCGTFVRVVEPEAVPFLNIEESTKNRIIRAEGVLLLLSAVGPGLVLLFRKRWANERLLQRKKSVCEDENLYEGLNVDECSMYEDISRGVQPTYQDVGGLPADDTLLEKP